MNSNNYPKSVLRSRTFSPSKFEGDLKGALEVCPSSCEYMFLNGVVWFVPSKNRNINTVIDTGLRIENIVQDVVPNAALEQIKALME